MIFQRILERLNILSATRPLAELAQLDITGISHDSRAIRPGMIFVAVRGFEVDGHRYLSQAAAQGAAVALVEHADPTLDLAQLVVADSREAQALAACAYYEDPSLELNLTGITGSNGKTTTSLMYRSILEANEIHSGLIGTVSYQTGQQTIASNLTTPDAIDLQAYLRQMVESGMHYAVMEVSSIAQDQRRNAGCHYDQVAFLNLSREHLDYHGDLESYFACKKRLIVEADDSCAVILNADDPYVSSLARDRQQACILFGEKSPEADLALENLDMSSGFAQGDLCLRREICVRGRKIPAFRIPFHLAVPGYHSLMNALAAVALALTAGFPLQTIVRGIENYNGVERRFQQVYDGNLPPVGNFRIFDDHFANVGNIRLTLETLRKMDYRHLHICYAIRGKRGVTVNRENVETLNDLWPELKIQSMTATLSREAVGHYDEVQPEELAVFKEKMAEKARSYVLFERLDEAVAHALKQLEAGDVLLLAGCQGMDAGARLALQKIAAVHPEVKEAILLPLQGRVCGWDIPNQIS